MREGPNQITTTIAIVLIMAILAISAFVALALVVR